MTVNGKRLPVSITLCDYKEYQRAEVILTPDKMTALAAQKMQESLADRLTGSTLLRIRTEGEFTEDAYYMTSYITLLEEIGEPLSFTANDK